MVRMAVYGIGPGIAGSAWQQRTRQLMTGRTHPQGSVLSRAPRRLGLLDSVAPRAAG